MSESDVYRRQILTYKDGPRAEMVNGLAQHYIDVGSMFAMKYICLEYDEEVLFLSLLAHNDPKNTRRRRNVVFMLGQHC